VVGALVGILEEGLAVVGWWEHSFVSINAHLADLPPYDPLQQASCVVGMGTVLMHFPSVRASE
jgi:hypothetical protein